MNEPIRSEEQLKDAKTLSEILSSAPNKDARQLLVLVTDAFTSGMATGAKIAGMSAH